MEHIRCSHRRPKKSTGHKLRSQVASYIISLINCDFLQFAYIKKDMEIRLQYFTVGIPVRARLVANVFLSCLT